jgi:hypothetical protein
MSMINMRRGMQCSDCLFRYYWTSEVDLSSGLLTRSYTLTHFSTLGSWHRAGGAAPPQSCDHTPVLFQGEGLVI